MASVWFVAHRRCLDSHTGVVLIAQSRFDFFVLERADGPSLYIPFPIESGSGGT